MLEDAQIENSLPSSLTKNIDLNKHDTEKERFNLTASLNQALR